MQHLTKGRLTTTRTDLKSVRPAPKKAPPMLFLSKRAAGWCIVERTTLSNQVIAEVFVLTRTTEQEAERELRGMLARQVEADA